MTKQVDNYPSDKDRLIARLRREVVRQQREIDALRKALNADSGGGA
jgi:hypothetical protein